MNGASFNMLLWLGLAVVALVGKIVFEHFATRAEERRASVAAHIDQTSAKLAGRS